MTQHYSWDYTDTKTVVEAYQLFTGETPLESQMPSLLAFVDGQQASYAANGLDPTLGGYEAISLGLATSAESDSQFFQRDAQADSAFGDDTNTLADTIFVEGMYSDIYDAPISTAVRDHYLSQLNYFQSLYTGVYSDVALMSHAAVAGQMLGYAQLSQNYASDYNTLGDLFWSDATDFNGTAVGFDTNGIIYYGIS